MSLVVVDYGMGNLGSMANMLKKIGAPAAVSSDPEVIAAAERLIVPGVGAFDNGMRNLRERGLDKVLSRRVLDDGVPVLGVCLGLQLFTKSSEEGQEPGLGWLDARTIRFRFEGADAGLKVPHMGWNNVEVVRPHPVMAELPDDARFYFVHSYHLVCDGPDLGVGRTLYGHRFVSVAGRDNIFGAQCHPEKSHRFGMQLLRNFAAWQPR